MVSATGQFCLCLGLGRCFFELHYGNVLPSFLRNLAIVNRTYSRYSPSLHAVFSVQKIVVELVYSRQQKVRKDYE